ncbi:MAG: zinc-binding dehydrogenase [Thaumarchaeota archaeon]|nr:zinc-binding dehydrogenase [Candidatus Calditenuaceae archaeon]MDW8187539.1 zinc-binding dehydrogenase [Nitrososphaerota archaeon]
MRAVLLRRFGEDAVLEDVQRPSRAPEGYALVEVKSAGVCYRDLLVTQGKFPRTRLPVVLGHEFAGKVVEVGGDFGIREGDLVTGLPHTVCGTCEHCLTKRENLCVSRLWYGEAIDGTFREVTAVDPKTLVRVPEGVSPDAASISSCVVGMLLHGIRDIGQARRGERALVTGAGGGVGIHAVQVAKAIGCKVVAATRSESKAEEIRRVGADELIVGSSFSEEVRRRWDGVDIVVECVGEPTFGESIRSLKWGGRIVLIGNVTAGNFPLPLGLVILKGLSVRGVVGSTLATLKGALEMMARGEVKSVVRTLRLEEFGQALEALKAGAAVGRFVLKP